MIFPVTLDHPIVDGPNFLYLESQVVQAGKAVGRAKS